MRPMLSPNLSDYNRIKSPGRSGKLRGVRTFQSIPHRVISLHDYRHLAASPFRNRNIHLPAHIRINRSRFIADSKNALPTLSQPLLPADRNCRLLTAVADCLQELLTAYSRC